MGQTTSYYLIVGPALIGLLGQGGHFPEHHAETPHVRLAREFSVLGNENSFIMDANYKTP